MRSLKKTLLFAFVTATFLCSITLFFISVNFSRKALRTVYRDDAFVIADRINDSVSEVIQEKFKFLELISSMDVFQDESISIQEKCSALSPIVKRNSKEIISLSYLSAEGQTYVNGRLQDFSSAPIIKDLKSKNSSVLFGPTVNNVTNTLSINIATPVKNEQGSMTGIILACLNCDFLCNISSRIKIGQTGYGIIIDRTTGNTIGAPQKEDVEKKQNLLAIAEHQKYEDLGMNVKKALEGKTDWGYFTIGGVKRVMFYRPVECANWAVVMMVSESEFIAKLKSMENILFGLTGVILLISLLVALRIGRSLNPLRNVGQAITEIASGNADLTKRLNIKKAKQEVSAVVDGFNKFTEKMQSIVGAIKDSQNKLAIADEQLNASTQDTAASITQIIANIDSVNSQILNQANSVQETAGAVNEIASNIESLEKMIENQSAGVTQASSAVEQMVGNINAVNSSVEKMVSSFAELEQNATSGIHTQADVNDRIRQIEEQSKMLQDANTAIAEIAEQTNLLAMNAAIEAAHAGEAGKGFSVVADEIRKLSETSTSQSKSIGDELTKIESSIIEVVSASDKATAAFTSVSTSIKSTDEILRQIRSAMEEQQIGSKQIIDALHFMNDSTTEVKSASKEMSEGNKHILSQIENLQNVTANMKDSITEMSAGAKKINETGASLSSISGKVTESIRQIGDEINQFKI